MTESILFLFLAGAIGALIKEIWEDDGLILPKIKNGKLQLGFIGSALIGGFVGYIVDGSYITAALAGFVGLSAITKLIPDKFEKRGGKILEDLKEKIGIETTTKEKIAGLIRYEAEKAEVDPELAVAVAKAESNLSPTAINKNTDGSRDRGLFQINEKWHPNITDEVAFDIILSTRFFCNAVKNGNLYWWKATEKVWNIDKKYNNMLK